MAIGGLDSDLTMDVRLMWIMMIFINDLLNIDSISEGQTGGNHEDEYEAFTSRRDAS